MRKSLISFFLILVCSNFVFSQANANVKDSLVSDTDSKLSFDIEFSNRYIWRGQSWGGNHPVLQPTLSYQITPKFSIGTWATINFEKDYYFSDGVTALNGYQELDFFVHYQVNDFMQIQLWDYYWPSVEAVEGVSNNYFNYSENGSKTVDLILYFDFSERYGLPLNATISTLIAGNDFSYNTLGENPKQNFTTYLELGYSISLFEESKKKILRGFSIAPSIGAVLNNQAEYYTYGDYDGVSFVNFSLKAIKEIELGKNSSIPISLTFIHNGASKNTAVLGRNYLITTLGFSF